MGGRRNTGVTEQPKPVVLSEWIKQPGRPVTRGEMVNVIAHLMERRIAVERELIRQRRWRVRFFRWLFQSFLGTRNPTAAEIERATAAALNPAATSTTGSPGADEMPEEDAAEEGGVPHIEQPYQETEEGTKYRDKRAPREVESPVTDSEGAE